MCSLNFFSPLSERVVLNLVSLCGQEIVKSFVGSAFPQGYTLSWIYIVLPLPFFDTFSMLTHNLFIIEFIHIYDVGLASLYFLLLFLLLQVKQRVHATSHFYYLMGFHDNLTLPYSFHKSLYESPPYVLQSNFHIHNNSLIDLFGYIYLHLTLEISGGCKPSAGVIC